MPKRLQTTTAPSADKQLASAIDKTVSAAMSMFRILLRTAAVKTGHSPGKPVGRPPNPTPARCVIPGCTKRAIAWKCCNGHYRKARREGLIPGIVAGNTKALAKMQQDGRATRWSKQKSKRK